MIRKFIIGCVVIFAFLFLFWYFYLRNERENRLTKQGNELVKKIEDFKTKNRKLPDSLGEIGIKETEDYPLYYEKTDSINFILWFAIGGEETKTYHSDSKKWEDFFRR